MELSKQARAKLAKAHDAFAQALVLDSGFKLSPAATKKINLAALNEGVSPPEMLERIVLGYFKGDRRP